MEIFNNLKTFLFNHRHKLIFSGIAVGGTVAVYNYIRYHYRKEKFETKELLKTLQRQKHFESLENICFNTILTSGISLKEEILGLFSIDSIVAYLKTTNDMKKWEELTSSIIIELCIMVYTRALLVLISKAQFSIIGGYLFRNVDQGDRQFNNETQYQYLSSFRSFSTFGLPSLTEALETELVDVIKDINSKLIKPCTMNDLRQLLTVLQNLCLNLQIVKDIPKYLAIEEQIQQTTDPVLKKILDETADVFSSEELVSPCLQSLLNCGFTFLTSELSSAYNLNANKLQKERSLFYVNVLPLIHNAIKTIPNEYWTKELINCDKLQAFSANIYESFS